MSGDDQKTTEERLADLEGQAHPDGQDGDFSGDGGIWGLGATGTTEISWLAPGAYPADDRIAALEAEEAARKEAEAENAESTDDEVAPKTFWDSVPSIGTADPDGEDKSSLSLGFTSSDQLAFPDYVLNPEDASLPYDNARIEGEDNDRTCINLCDSGTVDTLYLKASDRSEHPRDNLVLEAGDYHEKSHNHYQRVADTYRKEVGGEYRVCTGGHYHLYAGGDYIVEVGGRVISMIGGDTYLAKKQRTFNWGETRDYHYAGSYSEQWGDDEGKLHGDSYSWQQGDAESVTLGSSNDCLLGAQTSFFLGATFSMSISGGITVDIGFLKLNLEGSLLTAKITASPLCFEEELVSAKTGKIKTESDKVSLKETMLEVVKEQISFQEFLIEIKQGNMQVLKADLAMYQSLMTVFQ